MSIVGKILSRLAVFGVAAVVGGIVASVAVAALQDRSPVSTAGLAPEVQMAGADVPSGPGPNVEPGPVVAFTEVDAGSPEPYATLAPEDLAAAAAALLGGEPVSFVNPSGFPRIPPVTQFDGGPFQGSNCMLASGAMLSRLGYGIVTTGSILRTLQDDTDGGTGLNDLATALYRGYGVTFDHGLIRPDQLKALLAAGYGAAVPGDYSKVPRSLRLQPDYTGGHGIYLDGYYAGDAAHGIPPAYYVIDPLGRPASGYEGEWWPASVVDAFATSFGGGRVAAMWAFPPGGSAPDVVGPDVLPIPPDPAPGPSASAEPSPSASASVSPSPSGLVPPEAGDVELGAPPVLPVPPVPFAGEHEHHPAFDLCVLNPSLPGCPSGLPAVFPGGAVPTVELRLGPEVTVLFADATDGNVAMVGFTVDPPATADVQFWRADGTSGVQTSSSMTSISLLGTTVLLARLDTLADTEYRFRAVAGNGVFAGQSGIGTFTTGAGVSRFDVALSGAPSPKFGLVAVESPYRHLRSGAFAEPMLRMDALGGAGCVAAARFGSVDLCLDVTDLPKAVACTRAEVGYALTGFEATSILVRAFPVETGVTPDGDMTLGGVLEADGPAPAGDVSIGCLASGLTYHIVIDAVGDDRGILAESTVTVP